MKILMCQNNYFLRLYMRLRQFAKATIRFGGGFVLGILSQDRLCSLGVISPRVAMLGLGRKLFPYSMRRDFNILVRPYITGPNDYYYFSDEAPHLRIICQLESVIPYLMDVKGGKNYLEMGVGAGGKLYR